MVVGRNLLATCGQVLLQGDKDTVVSSNTMLLLLVWEKIPTQVHSENTTSRCSSCTTNHSWSRELPRCFEITYGRTVVLVIAVVKATACEIESAKENGWSARFEIDPCS